MIYEAESQQYLVINAHDPNHISEYHPKQCQLENLFNEVLLLLILKVTGISEDQLLVTVLPGLPTTAEIFIVPEKRSRHRAMDEKWAHLNQVLSRQIILMAHGRCSVQCGFYVIIKAAQKYAREVRRLSRKNIP